MGGGTGVDFGQNDLVSFGRFILNVLEGLKTSSSFFNYFHSITNPLENNILAIQN